MLRALPLIAVSCLAASSSANAQSLNPDGSVDIAGHRMSCPDVPVILDADVPTEGMYAPGEGVFLNPDLLKTHPGIIQIFLFAHECAHKTVDGDELGADCAAARQGARERWLTEGGIATVCRDLDHRLADETHPPGRTRCANIRRCFAGEAPKTIAKSGKGADQRQTFSIGTPRVTAESLRRAASNWRAAHASASGSQEK